MKNTSSSPCPIPANRLVHLIPIRPIRLRTHLGRSQRTDLAFSFVLEQLFERPHNRMAEIFGPSEMTHAGGELWLYPLSAFEA
jgi:hypothetical protein